MTTTKTKLVHKSGVELAVGDKARTFRGELVIVKGWRNPHHAGSTGRVLIETLTGDHAEYFPSVIDAKIV